MYSCHLFLIFSASVRSLLFLSFIMSILAWNFPLISPIFLKRSFLFYCFPPLLCIVHLRRSSYFFLLFSAFSWVYLSLSPLFFTSLLFLAICKTSWDNHIAFLHFFPLLWFWSPPLVQCYEPLPIILQALCLPDLIPWIYLSPSLYNHIRDLI